MHKPNILFFTFLIFLNFSALGQDLKNGSAFIFKPSEEISNGRKAATSIESILQLSDKNQLVKTAEKTDKSGFHVESYTQSYKGIPIEHAVYKYIRKGGRFTSVSGEYYNLVNFDTQPGISESAALQYALNDIQAFEYSWNQDGNYPKGELVICKNPKTDSPTLAYKFDIYALEPLSRDLVYVDAKSGQIILKDAVIKHGSADADTRFSGTQTIETTYSGSTYVLRDNTRGGGIETFDMNGGVSYSSATSFSDLDNEWTEDEFDNDEMDNAALDAHYGVEKTYDYFLEEHGRNSFDGNGAKINSYVHYGTDYINAFWNGEVLTFGDGGFSSSRGVTFEPLTTIDIVAHEYAHGLCQHTAGLVYEYESGALNESLSDIWGATIKYYADSTKNYWLMGDETNYYFRSFSNPNDRDQPDTYLGDYWYTGAGDRGGVHINSGVMNHWFYLLVEGGTGLNDNGDGYSVSSIGFDKATQIVYRMESIYMTPNSQYQDARRFAIQSAEDLFGDDSNEYQQCIAAWDAVGVYDFESAPTNLIASVEEDSEGVYVDLSWTDNSDWETNFEIYRHPTSSDSLAFLANVGANTTTFSDTLDAEGGGFIYLVRAASDFRKSAFSNEAIILAGDGVLVMSETEVESCNGILLDQGGLNNYDNDQEITMVISPEEEGKYVSLDFEEFGLERWRDYLRIYDGSSDEAPQIGSYTGSYLPEFIASSSEDGSLTLKFYSDNINTDIGFQANIGCLNTIPQPDLITYPRDSILSPTLPGENASLYYNMENTGIKRAPTSLMAAYLSEDKTIDSTDVFLTSWTVYSIDPGEIKLTSKYPSIPYTVAPGEYYMLWKIDYTNIVHESNEDNNQGFAKLTIEEPQIDLELSDLEMPTDIAAGNSIFVTLSAENTGNSTFPPTEIAYYLSTDSTYDSDDAYLGQTAVSAINTYNSREVSASVKIPDKTNEDDYYIIALLDPEDELGEVDEENNLVYGEIKVEPFGTYFMMPFSGSNTINTCSGTLYDNGGTSEYVDYSSDTLTIYPGEDGKYVQLTFINFLLYSYSDYLEIYNGPSTESPSFGRYDRSDEIPALYSTDDSGALTLRFYSNYYGTNEGFEAIISCIDEIPESDLILEGFSVNEPIIIKEKETSFSFNLRNSEPVPIRSVPYEVSISKDSLRNNSISVMKDTVDMIWLDEENIYSNFTLPDSIDHGSWFMWLDVNKTETISESNYDNNTDYQGVIVVDPVVDLKVEEASLSVQNPYPGASFSVRTNVKNKGAISSGSFYSGYYISENENFDSNAALMSSYQFSSIGPGYLSYQTAYLVIPDTLTKGEYFIHVYADHQNEVEELLEGNNTYSIPVTVTDPFKDFEMTSLSIDEDSIKLTEPFYIRGSYKNNGNQSISENYYLAFYLSEDADYDSSDVLFSENYYYSTVYAGETYNFSQNQSSSSLNVESGNYHLIALIDSKNAVEESVETNNTLSTEIYIQETIIDVSLDKGSNIWPDTINYQEQFRLYSDLTNNGNSDLDRVYVRLYLSTDSAYDDSDAYLDYDYTYSLREGQTQSMYINDYIYENEATDGKYYLIARVDFDYNELDTNPNDNLIIHPVYVKAPEVDLMISAIEPDNVEIYKGQQLSVDLTLRNNGPDDVRTNSYISTMIVTDTVSLENQISLGTRYVSSLDAYETYEYTYQYNYTNSLDTGTYYIVSFADYDEDIAETNETNNRRVARFRIINYDDTDVQDIPQNGTDTITTCDKLIADNGGLFGDYQNGSNGILTIYPETTGGKVSLVFSSFELETCCDYLSIYDGEDTNAELIGSYNRYSPDSVIATNASGALTLYFHSDGSVTYPGFVAHASCYVEQGSRPDLIAYDLEVENNQSLEIGGLMTSQLYVSNVGNMYSTDNMAYFYLSDDQDISSGDIYLGSQEFDEIQPNNGIQLFSEIEIPSNLEEGTYYLIIQVRGQHDGGIPIENNLENNLAIVEVNLSRIRGVTGVDNEDSGKIKVYPNPVLNNSNLTLEIAEPSVVLVYSFNGQLMLKQRLVTGKNELNIKSFPDGSYVIKCISKSGVEHGKFIIE